MGDDDYFMIFRWFSGNEWFFEVNPSKKLIIVFGSKKGFELGYSKCVATHGSILNCLNFLISYYYTLLNICVKSKIQIFY